MRIIDIIRATYRVTMPLIHWNHSSFLFSAIGYASLTDRLE